MGFLRKIGRKIKKGIKKLFSSKIGAFLGSMAINFMFPGIGNAFNSAFKSAKGALGFGTKEVVKETGKEIVKEAGKEIVKEAGKEVVGKEVVGKEIGKEITEKTLEKGLEKGFVDNTLTGSLEKLNQSLIDTTVTIGEKVPNVQDLTKKIIEESTIDLKNQITPQVSDIKLAQPSTVPELTFGEKIVKTGKDYFGESFIPDVASSVVTSYTLGAIQGEPEQPFISKGISSQPAIEAAQSAYLREVQSQIPNLPVTDFQQLNQSLLYGTLSPQFLAAQAREMGLAATIPGR